MRKKEVKAVAIRGDFLFIVVNLLDRTEEKQIERAIPI